MSDPIEIANDIKAAIAELADGRSYPDLLEAVDSLCALAAPTAPETTAEQAAPAAVEAGYVRVPVKPSDALLRPFYECPPEELKLAWNAMLTVNRAQNRRTAPAVVAEPSQPMEMSPEFTDTARSALLWVLWHHQGASSKVGQPIRFALGMGQYDRLNEHQVNEAKRWEAIASQPAQQEPCHHRPACEWCAEDRALAQSAPSPVEDKDGDPLIGLILDGLTLDELRAKAVYLMGLNANQARTIAEYEADAARYRHLVETCNVDFDPSEPWQLVIWEPATGVDWKAKLDEAIDISRALAQEGAQR